MILNAHARFDNPVANAVWWACITELEALKPGNVSVYSGGHGMTVDDFVTSARCIAAILSRPGLSVGERILRSVDATIQTVACNTNLGIVLLCAPLAHSVLDNNLNGALRTRVQTLLASLDISDAEQVFQAIRHANPGGLGHSPRHDVAESASASLIEIMRAAAERDRIAFQYAHGFDDIFMIGLPALQAALSRWPTAAWATVEVYLNFLVRFPDTHIQRKLGKPCAEQVRCDSERLLRQMTVSACPEQIEVPLRAFDDNLKRRGINPGTSADLTVATLFAYRLQALLHDFSRLSPITETSLCR